MNMIISKSGVPCLAESGGSTDGNTGRSQIVAGCSGEKKRAFFIVKGNINDQHAVIPVHSGDLIFVATATNTAGHVIVYQLDTINVDEKRFTSSVLEVVKFSEISTHIAYGSDYHKALKVAMEKSRTVNCNRAMYAINPRASADK